MPVMLLLVRTLRLIALTLGLPIFAAAQAEWTYDLAPTKTAFVRGGSFADMNFNGESTLLAKRGSDLSDTTILLASFVIPDISAQDRHFVPAAGLYFTVASLDQNWAAEYPFTNTGFDIDWDPATVTWNNFSGIGDSDPFEAQSGWTAQHNKAYIDDFGPPPVYLHENLHPGGQLFRNDFEDDWVVLI